MKNIYAFALLMFLPLTSMAASLKARCLEPNGDAERPIVSAVLNMGTFIHLKVDGSKWTYVLATKSPVEALAIMALIQNDKGQNNTILSLGYMQVGNSTLSKDECYASDYSISLR